MMQPRRMTLAVALALAAASSAAAQQPAPDLSALEGAAKAGAAGAQLAYGKALDELSRDDSLPYEARRASRDAARVWIRRAADQGLGEAWFWIGYAGMGPRPEVVDSYVKAAELGYPEAFGYALDALLFRAGPEADLPRAKRVADLARRQTGLLIHGRDRAEALRTVDACFQAGEPRLPDGDDPAPESRAGDESCSSLRPRVIEAGVAGGLYRDCVLHQRERDGNSVAELYANGWGVARNPTLAIALVCHASSVPAELEAMVDALAAAKDGAQEGPFTFCRYVTSAMNGQHCLDAWRDTAGDQRERALSELASGWTRKQRAALDAFVATAEDYVESSVRLAPSPGPEETPHYAELPVLDELEAKEGILAKVRALDAGPAPADRDFAAADRELNALWHTLIARKDLFRPQGDLEWLAFLDVQRRWVRYRDAWAALGKARFPKSSPDAWKARLTRERIAELRAY